MIASFLKIDDRIVNLEQIVDAWIEDVAIFLTLTTHKCIGFDGEQGEAIWAELISRCQSSNAITDIDSSKPAITPRPLYKHLSDVLSVPLQIAPETFERLEDTAAELLALMNQSEDQMVYTCSLCEKEGRCNQACEAIYGALCADGGVA